MRTNGNNAAEDIFLMQSAGEYNNDSRTAAGIIYVDGKGLGADNVQDAIDKIIDTKTVSVDYPNPAPAGDLIATIKVGDETQYPIKIPTTGGTVPELNDLDDVTIRDPATGQILTYNEGEWQNVNITDTVMSKVNPTGAGTLILTETNGLTNIQLGQGANAQVTPGNGSIAVGGGSKATGTYSQALGPGTTASGQGAQALGTGTTASGTGAHAEGASTIASGNYSHAEGASTIASGNQSHTEGIGTVAASVSQHASGRYNIADSQDTYIEIVGNGNGIAGDQNERANARTLDWQGNETIAGDLIFNGNISLTSELADKSEVTWNQIGVTGSKIAEISIDGTTTDIYAPTSGGATSLSGLSDVTITSATNGQAILYDSANSVWKNSNLPTGSSTLDGLTDVTISSPAGGQSLIYDSNSGEWINGAGGGGSSTLSGLTDVTITSATDGQALLYDSVNSIWVNGNVSSGSSTLDGLTDVIITSATDGQVLTYDSSNNKWKNATASGGATTLNGLSDVTITSASNSQVLTYNNGTWENAAVAPAASSVTYSNTASGMIATNTQAAIDELASTLGDVESLLATI